MAAKDKNIQLNNPGGPPVGLNLKNKDNKRIKIRVLAKSLVKPSAGQVKNSKTGSVIRISLKPGAIVKPVKTSQNKITRSPDLKTLKPVAETIRTNRQIYLRVIRDGAISKGLPEAVINIKPSVKKTIQPIVKEASPIPHIESSEPEVIKPELLPVKSSVGRTFKSQSDHWSDCGLIFYTAGKAYGLTSNLKTICIGTEEELQSFFQHGKARGFNPAQKDALERIKQCRDPGAIQTTAAQNDSRIMHCSLNPTTTQPGRHLNRKKPFRISKSPGKKIIAHR